MYRFSARKLNDVSYDISMTYENHFLNVLIQLKKYDRFIAEYVRQTLKK